MASQIVERTQEENGALVLFSGGQDSTVCLGWALSRYPRVETVGFDYGQRHGVELECRKRVRAEIGRRLPAWGGRLGPDHMIDITSFGAIGATALTSEAEIEMLSSGLPSTFVPGRNLVFFVYAAALGYRRGLSTLVGGMCETDYSGYPDCRDATLKALQEAIRLGTEIPFAIETPLMWRTKAETWSLAQELGGDDFVALIVEETHTCYRGERGIRHDWGYGCGTCPACELRAKGYAAWRASAVERKSAR
ncbi:7-cyano-7-deazaguanine synthase QueC [Methyloceanibacter sp.]|uniref:7-cyano-7-deazaguanine synthase QueC n=1 Tax=Methyloceanibacter sp. TaxID=1965321 RepID=UPI002D3307C6|nr:7-cyano-7-deazaguanine synthase QueC [Methyloceanibacter sp.]HZP09976.1 7-cyano-7-deazaguanine synthase QueC [Methyloceanibacter sp.]